MDVNGPRRPKVAVVYHFFAHYRAAVLEALLSSPNADYVLVGDQADPDGSIEAWRPAAGKLRIAPCRKLGFNAIWQHGVATMALRRDWDAMIFLGNANILSTWIAAGLARFSGKRVLFWTHGWIRRERGARAMLRNVFYRMAHGLLLYGNRAKTIGQSYRFARETLYVIYNSLDYEVQKAARSSVDDERTVRIRELLFGRSTTPVLICTSRLSTVRGLELLLTAMSLLREERFDTCLLLVGDGPERERLAQMAKDLRLAVHFYGPCYEERRLAELIMSANVTVAPGKVGLTAMHSLAYGTPVITHGDPDEQMPEWEAIEPGSTGDFFRRGDVRDLADKIKSWCLRPWPDEGIRHRCRAIIERYYNPEYQRSVIDRAVRGVPAEPAA
ncbi:MAG TPA: glycosyltransferase [Nitrospira sp.]|nr:glycosyltransferase [Nitrospira sp.]